MKIPCCKYRTVKEILVMNGRFSKYISFCTCSDKTGYLNGEPVIIDSPLVCHDCTDYELVTEKYTKFSDFDK